MSSGLTDYYYHNPNARFERFAGTDETAQESLTHPDELPTEPAEDEFSSSVRFIRRNQALASVTQLPVAERVNDTEEGLPTLKSADEETLPPTSLDTAVVRQLLDRNNDSWPAMRISQLLTYAWSSASTVVERKLPGYLVPFAPDNLADWYKTNRERIETIITAQKSRRFPRGYCTDDLFDDTEAFKTLPFIRNAAHINRLAASAGLTEGLRVEIAARLIVLETVQAARSETGRQD